MDEHRDEADGATGYYTVTGVATVDAETGDRVEQVASSDLTASLWGPDMQHGAPPSALLGRALEQTAPRPDMRVSRVVVEILGAVPIAPLEIRSRVRRPGRRIELVEAELFATGPDGTSRAVACATGWRLGTVDTTDIAHAVDSPLPADAEPVGDGESPVPGWDAGFVRSLDWRWVAPIRWSGAASAWLRCRPPLVTGERMSPLVRVLSVADVANGLGSRLDPLDWTFLNTELTVHLFREAAGSWIGVEAETSMGPDGIAMCAGTLHDGAGAIGRITQNVQVRAR